MYIYIYTQWNLFKTEPWINWKFCINQPLNKVPIYEIFVHVTCINKTPVYSKHKVGHKEAPFRQVLLYLIISVGNMSGDRQQAFWNPQDFTLMILQACAKYGIAPDVDWDMEMTPVDFAAEFVVRCSYNLSSILGKTYHIINDKPLHSR